MTAGTGWRLAIAAGMMAAVVPVLAPALADVRAGTEAWARGDYPRAVSEWRGPALAGDADAQFNLGQAYKLGRGVPADLAQAEIWYQKAALQGQAQAQDNYGLALFQDGRKADALPWLEKSVARDEKRTELVLGDMLFNGDGVAKDWVRAYGLVSRSSQQGLPQASQTLAQMDGYLSPEERQQGIALAGRIADQGRSAQMAAMAAPHGIGVAGARPAGVNATSSQAMTQGMPRQDRPLTPRSVVSTDLPPSAAPGRHRPTADAGAGYEVLAAAPTHAERTSPPPRRVMPVAAPRAVHVAPKPMVTSGGHWRVQLGAFHDEGNARALWKKVGAKVGGQPSYVHAAGVIRLQAGPFASKADAARACHAAGTSCVVVP